MSSTGCFSNRQESDISGFDRLRKTWPLTSSPQSLADPYHQRPSLIINRRDLDQQTTCQPLITLPMMSLISMGQLILTGSQASRWQRQARGSRRSENYDHDAQIWRRKVPAGCWEDQDLRVALIVDKVSPSWPPQMQKEIKAYFKNSQVRLYRDSIFRKQTTSGRLGSKPPTVWRTPAWIHR